MLKVRREGSRLWISGNFLGYRVRRSTGLAVGHERQAEAVRVEIEKEILEGRFREKVGKTKQTFREAVKAYLKWKATEGRLGESEVRMARVFESLFQDLALEDVTQKVVRQRTEDLWEGLKPGTVRRYLGVLNAILNHASGLWKVVVERIKRPKADDARDVHFTEGEAVQFLEWVRSFHPWVFPHFLVLIDCGVRLNELLQLERRDFDGDVLRVRRRAGKTETRTIPLTEDVQGIIRSMPKKGLVFGRRNGEPFGTDHSGSAALGLVLREGCDALGLKRVRVHDLRHTFAYLVAQGGADLGELQVLMGHSDVTQTMRYRGFIMSRAKHAIASARAPLGRDLT